jgi:hypothetical protein
MIELMRKHADTADFREAIAGYDAGVEKCREEWDWNR